MFCAGLGLGSTTGPGLGSTPGPALGAGSQSASCIEPLLELT